MPDPNTIRSMFARVAPRYDRANRLLSGGIDRVWRRRTVAAVRRYRPRDVLDLATGSGDVAFALAEGLPGGTAVTGMDFCQPMLDQAEARKLRSDDPRVRAVEFRTGDGLALPLPDASFDAVTVAFGLRNMADRAKAFAEMRRVLRPGGRVYVLEFSQPHGWFRPFYYLYLRRIAPRLAGIITGQPAAYDYLCDSIAEFPSHEGLANELRAAGFGEVAAERMTFGVVALHSALKGSRVESPGSRGGSEAG